VQTLRVILVSGSGLSVTKDQKVSFSTPKKGEEMKIRIVTQKWCGHISVTVIRIVPVLVEDFTEVWCEADLCQLCLMHLDENGWIGNNHFLESIEAQKEIARIVALRQRQD
jgi:hypothetical protein